MALACCRSMYYPGDGIVNNAPKPASLYKSWESGVIHVFVGVPPLPPSVRHYLRDVWTRLRRRVPERVFLVFKLISLLYGPEWGKAKAAVWAAAKDAPNMRDTDAWGEVGRRMGEHPGVGENVYRHLFALDQYGFEPFKGNEIDIRLNLAWLALKERHH